VIGAGVHRREAVALLYAALLAGCASPAPGDGPGEIADAPSRPAFPPDASLGTTRLFARVGPPGYPEGLAVDGGAVYVSSTARDDGAGAVFVHDLATGALLRTIAVEEARPGEGSFVVGLALDGAGRLYAAEVIAGRIVRIDPRREPPTQEDYATLPDLARCTPATPPPCSPTATDDPPFPNQPAFGPDGALYVSDSLQATVFRVPPGGGEPEAWFQDARFDVGFGANGIALAADGRSLYVAHSAVGPIAPSPTGGLLGAGGALWRVPLDRPDASEIVARFPGGLPDGLAVGASGRLYVTIIDGGLTGHGIAVRFDAYPWSQRDRDLLHAPSAIHARIQPQSPMRVRLCHLAAE